MVRVWCRTDVFPGIQFAPVMLNPNFGSRPCGGNNMRVIIRYSVLLAAVALLFPEIGFAEQPPGMVAASAGPQGAVVWAAGAPDFPRMPKRPGVVAPSSEARGEAPRDLGVERSGSSEIKKEDDSPTGAAVGEAAFLLPIWDRGFWLMPPGGLTRFLIPARGFINPEETLAADPAIVDSG